jgi:cold shock CspA family protein
LQKPIVIVARNLELSDALESLIRERAARLEHYYPELVGCSVSVEGPGGHHRKGGPYQVKIDLRVPAGEPLTITRQSGDDLQVALRESFDAAVRRLQDFARLQRGQVKVHELAPTATVARLVPEQDCGFLATADGRELYFHRHSVLGGGFDELTLGAQVRYHEERGDQGPQASTVEALES